MQRIWSFLRGKLNAAHEMMVPVLDTEPPQKQVSFSDCRMGGKVGGKCVKIPSQ